MKACKTAAHGPYATNAASSLISFQSFAKSSLSTPFSLSQHSVDFSIVGYHVQDFAEAALLLLWWSLLQVQLVGLWAGIGHQFFFQKIFTKNTQQGDMIIIFCFLHKYRAMLRRTWLLTQKTANFRILALTPCLALEQTCICEHVKKMCDFYNSGLNQSRVEDPTVKHFFLCQNLVFSKLFLSSVSWMQVLNVPTNKTSP